MLSEEITLYTTTRLPNSHLRIRGMGRDIWRQILLEFCMLRRLLITIFHQPRNHLFRQPETTGTPITIKPGPRRLPACNRASRRRHKGVAARARSLSFFSSSKPSALMCTTCQRDTKLRLTRATPPCVGIRITG